MNRFATSRFCAITLLVLGNGFLMQAMQKPPAYGFPAVPAHKQTLFKWLDQSHIPRLEILIVRTVYRHMCHDVITTKKIWNEVWDDNNCSPFVAFKKLIRQSPVEMETAIKKYAALIKQIDVEKITINYDGCFDSQKEPLTVYVGDIIPHAIMHNRGDMLALLAHRGVPPRVFVGQMIYAWIWPQIYLELLEKFLLLKPIDMSDKCNNWPLMIAATTRGTHTMREYCHISDVLYALLSAGADPNAREDRTGQTPLIKLCAHEGCALCIKLLLAKGADIEARDDEGKRAIVYAIESQNLEAFQALMEHNACTGFMVGNQTLFELALKKNSDEIIRRLRIAQQSHTEHELPPRVLPFK